MIHSGAQMSYSIMLPRLHGPAGINQMVDLFKVISYVDQKHHWYD